MFAVVSDQDIAKGSSLDAGAWVRACVTPLGGRGGGKPANAQGSVIVEGANDTTIAQLMDYAKTYVKSL